VKPGVKSRKRSGIVAENAVKYNLAGVKSIEALSAAAINENRQHEMAWRESRKKWRWRCHRWRRIAA